MKPRLAVHKFASCDGCQLALLNAGEQLLHLSKLVDIVHFAEAGPLAPDADVDIAIIEGSITTPRDAQRILTIREHSRYLITIGACATSGGIQALRSYANINDWVSTIYAQPEYIQSLARSTPIREHIRVDFELWGCPVNTTQLMTAIRDLLSGVTPKDESNKVCQECKRRQHTCVMVSRGQACLGPVTRNGCGALCPAVGRACYGCYGPAENINSLALATQFASLGLTSDDIVRHLQYFYSGEVRFAETAKQWKNQ
jgi:sulfhydrogenase subunit delta